VKENNSERLALEVKYKDLIKVEPRLGRKLVSFQGNKEVPFYGWFSFKEAFSSEMVKFLISDSGKKNGQVLDPFAGIGTTLFASRALGLSSVGIELLPTGDFFFKSRIAAEEVDPESLWKVVQKLKSIDFGSQSGDTEFSFKHLTITSGAFPLDTEQRLNAYLTYCNREISNQKIRQLLLFGCFCILEKISYTRKDGQYLRWDQRARKGKGDFNKGKLPAFEDALSEKLTQIVNDMRNARIFNAEAINQSLKVKLITGSSLEEMPRLEEDSFDFIISSPPYCNRYDYTRTYALELAFLEVNQKKIGELRQELLSCTVENKDKKEQLRRIYAENRQNEIYGNAERSFNTNKALIEILGILGKYAEEGKLNNPGIYRMVENYFYEHAFVVHQFSRLLKRGGRAYYVNDNVRYAGESIPVDLILSEFAEDAGLKVEKIMKLPNGKGNSSQQMGKHGREEMRKCVYVWVKET
jgi:hypothetical protein